MPSKKWLAICRCMHVSESILNTIPRMNLDEIHSGLTSQLELLFDYEWQFDSKNTIHWEKVDEGEVSMKLVVSKVWSIKCFITSTYFRNNIPLFLRGGFIFNW